MPCMLWGASVIEGIIGAYIDMGILLGIQVLQSTIPQGSISLARARTQGAAMFAG